MPSAYPISRSKELTREAILTLEACGWTIKWDWTTGPARTYDEADWVIAHRDYQACRDADLIFMMWAEGMKGAYTELGMGYALHKRVVVVGCKDRNDNIFLRLPDIEFYDTLDEAIKAL
jgi:hypothetical protein